MIHFPVESKIIAIEYSNGGFKIIFKNGTAGFISVDDVFNRLKDLHPTKETLKYRSENMNKDQQIEEMAKIVDEYFEVYDTTPKEIAESLYEAGYRKGGPICVGKPTSNEGKTEPFYQKVKDEKVYLSKEEYSDYLTIKLNYEFVKSANEQLQIDNRRLYTNLAKYKEAVQIETAKEIFKWLKAHSDDAGFIIIKTYFAERFGVMEDEKDKD